MITTKHQHQLYAPCTVWFSAPKSLYWDFGDNEAKTHWRVQKWSGNGLQFAEGKYVAHTFTKPGTYVVTASDDKGVVSNHTIEVAHWFGETWGVAPDGIFDGVSFDKTFTDYSDALEAYRTKGQPTRLLLKRDHIYEHKNKVDVRRWGGRDHFILGAFDKGHNPRVTAAKGVGTMFLRGNCSTVSISDIDFFGSWDSTKEQGDLVTFFTATAAGNVTFDNCKFDGISITANIRSTGCNFAMNACSITNWKDYGILAGEVGDLAIMGSYIQQDRLALPGGPKGTPHNHHGPVRVSNPAGKSYIGFNSLFSKNGWSYAGANNIAHQACLRWNVQGYGGAKLTCENNVMEGGWSIVDNFGNTSTAMNTGQDAEFHSNLFIGTANTFTGIRMGHSGTTIEDNLFLFPDMPSETIKTKMFAVEWDKSKGISRISPNIVKGNEFSGIPEMVEEGYSDNSNNLKITPAGDVLFYPLYISSPYDFIKVEDQEVIEEPKEEAPAEDTWKEDILSLIEQIRKLIEAKA